ncbi:phosphatase PAP2 family protein [Deinococcus planocerae]|uniref:phosphatase PAP2 family protein n=1 Tax=Deinococcus planocerae TaxID=1737569 RepID=UPI000C7F6B2D|nr:phosphatase PAP2 family protein [Deinococcus planocerae]
MRRRLPGLLARHWRQLALLFLGVLLPLALFADLAEDIFREGGFAWDRAVLGWYAAHRTPTLTGVAHALAWLGGLGGLPLLVLVFVVVLVRLGARAQAWFLIAAVAGASVLNGLAKGVFQRPRPTGLGALVREPGFSFPSGHAMSNAAFGCALILIFWRSRAGWPVAVAGGLWAVAVGASRNYLGVHYPSDVLAGFAASAAWVAGLYLILSRRWSALRRAPQGEADTR